MISILLCDNSEIPVLDIAELESIDCRIKVYIRSDNPGYGRAHNYLFREGEDLALIGKFHVVMNLDVVVHPVCIERLASFMTSNERVVHAMPKVLGEDGSVQQLCKYLPTPFQLLLRRGFAFFNFSHKSVVVGQYDYTRVMKFPYLSGCFMFLRSQAFKDVGMFDERFFLYPEDIDLTRRLYAIGDTVCYPFVSIQHAHARASYKSLRMLVVHATEMFKYFCKWGWIFDSQRNEFNAAVDDALQRGETE